VSKPASRFLVDYFRSVGLSSIALRNSIAYYALSTAIRQGTSPPSITHKERSQVATGRPRAMVFSHSTTPAPEEQAPSARSDYGPIALYVGNSGEVQFKETAYGDLGLKVREKEVVSNEFPKQRPSDFYYGWSSVAADFNRDGIMDIV
jgi:hypothetical protein